MALLAGTSEGSPSKIWSKSKAASDANQMVFASKNVIIFYFSCHANLRYFNTPNCMNLEGLCKIDPNQPWYPSRSYSPTFARG